MKRLVLSMAAILVALSASAGTVTKNFEKLNKFSGIQIANAFDATLVQGDEYKATVTIDTELEEYLDVSVIGSVLYVRLKDAPVKLKNLDRKSMKITITTPSLCQIALTGASELKSDDVWTSPMEKFLIDISGASKAEKLKIEAGELEARISGASNATISGDFAEVDVDASGASALFLIGNYEEIDVDAEGTTKVSIMGTADKIDSECKGSSHLDAIELKVQEAEIKCSGASKATIDVQNKLDVELKGASTCHYRSSNASLNVMPSVSRASSFKKVK